MSASSYLRWLGGTVLVLALIAIALTIAVDPYYAFGIPGVSGWTALKPRVYEQSRMAKVSQLERNDPQTLILGNSRAEVGFDPLSPAWPMANRPVFNAAMAGGTIFDSLMLLQDAIAHHPPSMIVMGVDFQDFLTERTAPSEPGETERRLLVDAEAHPNPARALQRWKDRLRSTLTIDAVVDSIITLADQDPKSSATMTPLGFNPLLEYRVYAERSGYHTLFAEKDASYRKQYAAYIKPDFSDPRSSPAYRHLAAILEIARKHKIGMTLFLYPYHAQYLEMLHDLGLWPSFEAWKRTVLNLVAGSGQDVQLFDFAEYDALTTETVPWANDRRSVMQWYWEPGHFKSSLGDHILEAMFSTPASTGQRLEFGHSLTLTDIEPVLTEVRRQRLQFLGNQPAALKAATH